MIASIGWYLDYGFLRGTGAGEPLGVLNDPAKITVAKQAEQAADTVVYTNLAKMLARLHPACVSNSVWVASPTTIPPLLELTIDVGTAGSHIPVSKELGGGGFSILTRPVIFTEKMPALGTEGDIGLYDFSQYSVGLRKEVGVEKSIHPGFASDASYYRSILRGDGQGRWSQPLTPKNGDTLSWCVTLADR